MKIINFIIKETNISKRRLLVLAAVSGTANSLLLIILNEAATALKNNQVEIHFFLQYVLVFILFIFSQRTAQKEAVMAVEQAIQKVRIRLANKIRNCDLYTIEQLGSLSHYTPLMQSANTISQAAMYMIIGFESLLVLIFASFYLFWLSPPSFTITIILVIFTLLILIRRYHVSFKELSSANQKEGQFFEHFSSMLKGFKQIKINSNESDNLFQNLKNLANQTSELKSRANARLMGDTLLSNMTFYLLLLIIVFLLPYFFPTHEEQLFQIIATVLFMMEPVSTLSSAIPNMSKTNVSIGGLYQLEKKLDKICQEKNKNNSPIDELKKFQKIKLSNICFTYKNEIGKELFQVDPFNIEINKGDLLFITGPNGSGKSSLLKLLTALYKSDKENCIKVDDQIIQEDNLDTYRKLFAIVFNDFYLFDRLYDFRNTDTEKVNYWLEKMDLARQTQFKNGAFTRTNLSTGQRKRLAFVVAIIQDRPILILDEFTADQDPDFRKYFYNTLLPILRSQGKTIIAVTHDKNYFHLADKIFYMDAGRLWEPLI